MRKYSTVLCVDCGTALSRRDAKRCHQCDRNYQTLKSLSAPPPNQCVDCGTPLSERRSKRCVPCYLKNKEKVSRQNNPTYRPNNKCDNCGKKVTDASTRICMECIRSNKEVYYCKGCNTPWPPHRAKTVTGYCKKCYTGERTRRWNPNLTPDQRANGKRAINPEYRDWKIQVHIKDDHTCLKCKKKGGRGIVAHHIHNWDRYPDLRYDVQNGATLCKKCHRRFHNLFGNRHNTRQQFEDFITSKVK